MKTIQILVKTCMIKIKTSVCSNIKIHVYIYIYIYSNIYGAVLQIGRSLVRSQLVSLEFFIDKKSFRSRCGLGVDPTSNRNEYQEHFLGVKAAGA